MKKLSLKSSVADPFHFDMDPFREITDPVPDHAPNPSQNRENINFCFTFFSIKNIFLRNMTCFDIYGVNIYVSKHKFNSFEKK